MANVLKRDKQRAVIAMLCDGASIRSTERVTGVHRDTIMRLLVRVGEHCMALLDEHLQGLSCEELQVDEIWTYIGKKQGHVLVTDPTEFGDCYLYTAVDPISKLFAWHHVAKRTPESTYDFIDDLAGRVPGRVQVSTDGYAPYIQAVQQSFGGRAAYGQAIKIYATPATEARRYSPPSFVSIDRVIVRGTPRYKRISTSIAERGNLSIRTFVKRFTRLTICFSRKLDNLRAAVALFMAWFNFVRIHRSLGMTPGMAARVTDRLWTIDDLLPPN